MSKFFKLFNVSTPFDGTNRFQTSYLFAPMVLAIIRLTISTYIFTTLVYRLVRAGIWSPADVRSHWSYFTNLTYWGQGFYFMFAGFHTFVYARKGIAPLQKWPRILQLLHGVLYTTVCTYALVVTIVYWALIAPDSAPGDGPFASVFSTWSNISVHAMNTGFALFEIFFTRTERPPWIHMCFTVVFLAMYLGLAYVTYATQGFYTYNFLNPGNGVGSLVEYIFGIFAASLIIFVVVWLLIWFREWVAARLSLEGKLAQSHVGYTAGRRDKEELPEA
ncbi:hypothetical protein FN846DRAFT_595758 [Sphaerosporella brunnea]|uniref:FAR-17a/AIG1-like protein n=1 Tax=Sphaerosporella brunnea TaxID=1250544 RepID=A0A5J5ECX9_9PEZI|nr:hypothetical protein FN846DRAFT_595758 [Sphaerosporella brunnea]